MPLASAPIVQACRGPKMYTTSAWSVLSDYSCATAVKCHGREDVKLLVAPRGDDDI